MPVNTVEQAEETLQAALLRLGSLLHCPDGFYPVVQFFEGGRKKRKDASIENWSAAKGEIRISFAPGADAKSTPALAQAPVAPKTPPGGISKDMEDLIAALQEAETAPGRSFVALKWFRDEILPARMPQSSPGQRQALITQAIQEGWILTGKVPNPKAPLYPTTSIRLNRQKLAGGGPAARFHPVPIAGEPLSATILKDRGPR